MSQTLPLRILRCRRYLRRRTPRQPGTAAGCRPRGNCAADTRWREACLLTLLKLQTSTHGRQTLSLFKINQVRPQQRRLVSHVASCRSAD